MSSVEAYLAELQAALGDRLPPSVHTARLREARAHLLASSEEVGEAEAIRRYGRARAVGNGLVRAHRGYEERSAWSLTLPLAAGFLTIGAGSLLVPRYPATFLGENLGPRLMLFFVLAFAFRAVQTRRWIAGPMIVAHGAGAFLIMLLSHAVRRSHGWSLGETLPYLFGIALFGAAWCAVNALALGAGSLLDLRRVRRAGGSR